GAVPAAQFSPRL
nr:RecName: Full=Locustamyotropin-1; AltName: Full=Lom-MT-1 [Locusta migratoria]